MSMQHVPASMTYAELGALLRDVAECVDRGDSFEGFIEYLLSDGPGEVDVRARYRIGNLDGQGGMIVVGSFE